MTKVEAHNLKPIQHNKSTKKGKSTKPADDRKATLSRVARVKKIAHALNTEPSATLVEAVTTDDKVLTILSRGKPPRSIEVAQRPVRSKRDQVTALLSSSDGATIADLMRCTGWQAHSVRGFLSGTIRKRKGLLLLKVRDEQGVLRYRVQSNGAATP
jgi:hypothetical protein